MNDTIVPHTTCFEEHQKRNLECNKESCRNWMKCSSHLNCAIVAAQKQESHTLQEIGDIFGVTRMRICQIEKSIMKKLREQIA